MLSSVLLIGNAFNLVSIQLGFDYYAHYVSECMIFLEFLLLEMVLLSLNSNGFRLLCALCV